MQNFNLPIPIKLSIIWVTLLINMLFADIFSLIIEIKEGGVMDIPLDPKNMMAIAAVLTNIPILMVFLSIKLNKKPNRIVNICAAIFTVIYIIGGYSPLPHYYIIATIECILACLIIKVSWNWN